MFVCPQASPPPTTICLLLWLLQAPDVAKQNEDCRGAQAECRDCHAAGSLCTRCWIRGVQKVRHVYGACCARCWGRSWRARRWRGAPGIGCRLARDDPVWAPDITPNASGMCASAPCCRATTPNTATRPPYPTTSQKSAWYERRCNSCTRVYVAYPESGNMRVPRVGLRRGPAHAQICERPRGGVHVFGPIGFRARI